MTDGLRPGSSPEPPGSPEQAAGPRTARAMLPPTDRAPLAARRVVSSLLVAWGYADQVELAELVVSELVSNAVRHAGDAGDLELELSAGPDGITLWVADGSPEHPVLDPGSEGARAGLGLQLVDRVARSWAVEDYLFGKRVRVELAPSPA